MPRPGPNVTSDADTQPGSDSLFPTGFSGGGALVRSGSVGTGEIADGSVAAADLNLASVAPALAGRSEFSGTYAIPSAPAVLYATAPNAPVGMAVPTPDGTAQITHVGVVKAATPWNGFRYWLVGTPYANQNDQVENPCIYAANDPQSVGGTNGWQVPAGLTNPIEPTPGDGQALISYNSDPDLEFGPDGKLYCFWRLYDANNVGTEEKMYVKSSSDGITWSAKTAILTNNAATMRPVAPSVVYDATAGLWRMWAVDIQPSPNVVRRWSAPAATGPWTLDGAVTLTGLQSGREAWHIDVNVWPYSKSQTVHMLINDVVTNTNGGGGRLYLAESTDGGMTFTVGQKKVIQDGTGRWDSTLYRSSMVPIVDVGRPGYEVFYTAFNSATPSAIDVRFGYTTTLADAHAYSANPVHGIADPALVNLLAAKIPLSPFVLGDTFQRADGAIGTADSGQTWTAWAGTFNVASKVASPSVDGNTKAVINGGISDLYAEMTVTGVGTSATQAWLIVRGSDTNNYWRLGLYNVNGGSKLGFEKVTGGSSIAQQSFPLGGYWSGIKIGARCSGSTITLVVNGQDVFTVTDVFNQTATNVGIQANQAAVKVGYIFARSLVVGR